MKITPIDDRVLIKRFEQKEQKVGSLYVPESAKEKPQVGIVLAVGTDEELQELFKKDDRILFGKYSGSEFELDGEEYIILQRSDILAKLEE